MLEHSSLCVYLLPVLAIFPDDQYHWQTHDDSIKWTGSQMWSAEADKHFYYTQILKVWEVRLTWRWFLHCVLLHGESFLFKKTSNKGVPEWASESKHKELKMKWMDRRGCILATTTLCIATLRHMIKIAAECQLGSDWSAEHQPDWNWSK